MRAETKKPRRKAGWVVWRKLEAYSGRSAARLTVIRSPLASITHWEEPGTGSRSTSISL